MIHKRICRETFSVNDRHTSGQSRLGFTIVELLVVVAIVGIIMAIVLPAVQQSREASRRVKCQNNLRQLSLGVHNFMERHTAIPANGWGYRWIGDPQRGVGKKQPGGWIFQLLPDIEQRNLWELAASIPDDEKAIALADLCQTPVALLKCPSRPCPQVTSPSSRFSPVNANRPATAARTDYAINEGDKISNTGGGPSSLQEGDDPSYPWTNVSAVSGVSWQRGSARAADIVDGLSNVIMLGEKHVSVRGYFEAVDPGYDQPMLSGVDLDLNRWTLETPLRDSESAAERSFGSAHPSHCVFAFCDGSVRAISFNVDAFLFQKLGNRFDGGTDAF